MKYPVKVLIFLPYLLRYLNKTQRGVWSHTDMNNGNLWGNLQLLIQEALAPLHFLEPVGLFCKAGPCRLCPGATARGDGGRSSSSLLWAGEGVQLFQQLSCVVGYCLALLKLVTHPLSAHPWVIQAPVGSNLYSIGVIFERNEVNECDKLQYFKD